MTHTAEPMTLSQALALIKRMKDQHTTKSTTCRVDQTQLDAIHKVIYAELAKQREAEPIGEVRWMGDNPATGMIDVRWKVEPEIGTKLYTHPQQRNAVEVTDELCRRLITKLPLGASAFLHVENVREALEATFSAVASRYREDAERYRKVKTLTREQFILWRGAFGLSDKALDDIDASRESDGHEDMAG